MSARSCKPGDLIAQLDPADYRLAVDNARAALASADADYARAKADHERYLGTARQCRVHAPDARTSASRWPPTAQARVDQARSQLASAENNLAYTELRADAAGVVIASAGRGRPGAGAGPGRGEASPAPTNSRSWSACPSIG